MLRWVIWPISLCKSCLKWLKGGFECQKIYFSSQDSDRRLFRAGKLHLNMHFCSIQGVSRLTVIYNIQNAQIWVMTQEFFFTFFTHGKINFHLKVIDDNFNNIFCPKMLILDKGSFNFWDIK